MIHPTCCQPLAAGVATLAAPCLFAQPAWRTKSETLGRGGENLRGQAGLTIEP